MRKRCGREACAGFVKVLGVNAFCTVTAYKDFEDFIKSYPTASMVVIGDELRWMDTCFACEDAGKRYREKP